MPKSRHRKNHKKKVQAFKQSQEHSRNREIKEYYRESIEVLCQIMNDVKYNQVIEEAVWLNYELLKKPMIKENINLLIHSYIFLFNYTFSSRT